MLQIPSLFEVENNSLNTTNVLSALKGIRAHVLKDEYALHQMIKQQLTKNGIHFEYEYRLSKGNRVDFFTMDGTVIEAKKGKPNYPRVVDQLSRYASFNEVVAVILVIERYMILPETINGKPCFSIGLNQLWGISSK